MLEKPFVYHVLVVEDDAPLASMVADFLAPHGFDVSIASRGDTAVIRIQEDNPDAVVLDVNLPGLDGFAVCKAVRAHYRGPIIMLTAESGKENVMKIVKMGVKDYMVKPFKGDQLIERVNKIVSLEEKKSEEEQVDTSKLYFAMDGDYRILTLPKKITRGVSSDIEHHLGDQLKDMLDNGKKKFIMDLSKVKEINISLIKLILIVTQTCNKSNVTVRAVGTPTLREGLKEFSETSELPVSGSIEDAKGAF